MIRRRKFRFYKGEIKDVLRLLFSGKIANGEYAALFEEAFAGYIGTKFAISTCSGRYALEMILEAFKLKPGDEIIMPAYTLKDLVYLVESKGFIVKFVDIEGGSFNMDAGLIEGRITPKTRAIIATHLFGLPCNIEKISQIAKKHNLPVIEDCAHSLGAGFKGRRTGSFGDAAFFSFEALKLINTFGGGMVTTNDAAIAAAVKLSARKPVRSTKVLSKIAFNYFENMVIMGPLYPLLLRLFLSKITSGMISKFYLLAHHGARISQSGFSNLQALMGLRQLDALDERNKIRANRAEELKKMLNGNITIQHGTSSIERVYYFLVAKTPAVNNIEETRRSIAMRGVDVGIREEITDNCARTFGQESYFPVASEAFNSNRQLPLYDDLTKKEMLKISSALKSHFS